MTELLSAAHHYTSKGISVVGCTKQKTPIGTWKDLQTRILSQEELSKRFEQADAIAIICGEVSGGLEVVDVDLKYDVSGTLYTDLKSAIDPDLWKRLVIASTISGGYHLYYRCSEIEGSQKLARRGATAEELEDNPHANVFVLLETRGRAGYVVADPSPGYKFIQGGVDSIQTITPDERDHILQAARSLNSYLDTPRNEIANDTVNSSYTLTPWEDYNKRGNVIDLLIKHGWKYINTVGEKHLMRRPGKDSGTSGDYHSGKGWFAVFTTSSVFEPNKAYTPFAVYALLECKGDYKEAARRLAAEGYGSQRKSIPENIRKVVSGVLSSGATPEQAVTELIDKLGMKGEAAQDAVKMVLENAGEKVEQFWSVSVNRKGVATITILRDKLSQFLYKEGGFQRYYYDPENSSFRIVKNKNGKVENVNMADIQDFVMEYIRELPNVFDSITKAELIEKLRSGAVSYFSEKDASFLEAPEIKFIKDTKDTSYFFFRNGIVTVTGDSIGMINYKDAPGVIWKSQLIDFDIDIINDFTSKDGLSVCEFESFLALICGEDIERLRSAVTITGYCLHKYKGYNRPYAVVLAEESDNEDDGGGTGKGIYVTALSKLLNTEQIDGKNFSTGKNFAFQRIQLDTQLMAIQDVKKNMDFEEFYSIITEGVTVERKNKDELFIPYHDSPKVLFTTNYAIRGEANHAKRRQKTILFSSFFSPSRTPEDYFGHMMFIDWDGNEWNAFYNYMFLCCQMYLKNGIIGCEEVPGMKYKKIKVAFGQEFREWFESYTANGCQEFKLASDLYHQFVNEFDLDQKFFSVKKFKKGIETSCRIFGHSFERRKNSLAGGKHEYAIQLRT